MVEEEEMVEEVVDQVMQEVVDELIMFEEDDMEENEQGITSNTVNLVADEPEAADALPKRKKQKIYEAPEDCNSNHLFYSSGLHALASILANQLKNRFPQYTSAESQLPTKFPTWIAHYSTRGMCPPTEDLVDMVKNLDKLFNNIHGQSINKGRGLVKSFVNIVTTENSYPSKVVSAFAVLRILIRVRALNKRNKNQKQEEADLAKLAKKQATRSLRQKRQNQIWNAGRL